MTVKRKFGKDEIEVSGTEAQCKEMLDRFFAEVQTNRPIVEVCDAVRAAASARGLANHDSRPVLDLLKEMLGV